MEQHRLQKRVSLTERDECIQKVGRVRFELFYLGWQFCYLPLRRMD